ncbi:hypothetical protein LINPERHAP2_LOCUS28017 [Linum perenne]
MREQERVRGLSVLSESGGRSKVVRSSGRDSSVDRFRRSLQIKDSQFACDSSDGRFGSVCRLSVSNGSVSHFVFLDRSSILWLEGVLQVASSNRWVFPSPCSSSSVRRSVSVRVINTSVGLRLKISEECSNGKLFYILIPADPSSRGWFGTVRSIQSWIANFLVPLPPLPPISILPASLPVSHSKSFAQAVTGSGFSLIGRCTDFHFDGVRGVKVEGEGIKDRLLFLDGCVVFRFGHLVTVNWEKFRRWALRNWGIGLDASIYKLGDGLWLMFCGSKDNVNRILALKRWSFDGQPLMLDKWIPSAGRSNVLLNADVIWVTARGIPLHLRSNDLFRQLGDSCGRFLDFENGDSLSSVRIKIELTGALPEEVPICFDDMVFPVSISREGMPISGFLPVRSALQNGWCSKGKSSLFPRSAHSADLGCSSQSVSPLPSQSLARPKVASKVPSEVAVSSKVSEVDSNLALAMSSTPRSCSSFVGFKLNDKDDLCLFSASRYSSLHLSGWAQVSPHPLLSHGSLILFPPPQPRRLHWCVFCLPMIPLIFLKLKRI